jgi:hypothetical protein
MSGVDDDADVVDAVDGTGRVKELSMLGDAANCGEVPALGLLAPEMVNGGLAFPESPNTVNRV